MDFTNVNHDLRQQAGNYLNYLLYWCFTDCILLLFGFVWGFFSWRILNSCAVILCQENKLRQTCFLLWENSVHLFRHFFFITLSRVKELHYKGWLPKACVNQKGRCIFLNGYLCIQKGFSLELVFQCRSPKGFLILRGNRLWNIFIVDCADQ